MSITRKSAIGAIAAIATASLLTVGAGAAVAANASNSPWGNMMGGSRTGLGMVGGIGAGNGYGLGSWCGFGAGDGYGPGMMRGLNSTAMMNGVAEYLGLSTSDLLAQLRGGSSLADIAANQGKSAAGLKDVMLRAMQQYLDRTSLTTAQRSHLLTQMRSHLPSMLNAKHAYGSTAGFRGMMGGNWGDSY